MKAPPTWRDLMQRATRLALKLEHGRHVASLVGPRTSDPLVDCRFVSWTGRDPADAIILRTAVAAALEQMERAR